MSTRAELETAILTGPYCAAREAAYLDWIQEFEPAALPLARAGLLGEGLKVGRWQPRRSILDPEHTTYEVRCHIESPDLLEDMRCALVSGFLFRLGKWHYRAFLVCSESGIFMGDTGRQTRIEAELLLYAAPMPV